MPVRGVIVVLLAGLTMDSLASPRAIPFEPGGTIEIDARLTRLFIVGDDGARIEIEADSAVRIDADEGHARIRVSDPAPVSLEIRIPQRSDLVVRGALADMRIENIHGSLIAHSENNPIFIDRIVGDVDARSFLAAVEVSDVQGSVRAESNMAAVTMTNIEGTVWARSAAAGVSLTSSRSDRIELHTTRGTIMFSGLLGGQAVATMVSHSGAITVDLARRSNVAVQVHGARKQVAIEGARAQWTNGDQTRFALGDGEGKLSVQTLHGPVNIRVLSASD